METAQGKHTETLGIGPWADLTNAEYRKTLSPYTITDDEAPLLKPASNAALDWRSKGAVTAVKNQQQCGSCWAFSTTGSMEGAVAIKTGKLVSFSEEQLVDCSKSFGNNGCEGGLMDNAFKYVIENKGLTTEENYPYTAKDGVCDTAKAAAVAGTITSFVDVTKSSEDQMLAALAIGPVSVAIEADEAVFQHYAGGVLSGTCGTQLDHGVLAVGYGDDTASGLPYCASCCHTSPRESSPRAARAFVCDLRSLHCSTSRARPASLSPSPSPSPARRPVAQTS